MPSEHAFLCQRLALVEQELANPDREFVYVGDGAPWIIDDRFLALLNDLIERLEKWLEEA